MCVKHIGELTTVKVPEHRDWLERSERVFEEKWGWVPPPIARYRRTRGTETWHFCQNCSRGPLSDYEEAPRLPSGGIECEECKSLRDCQECAFHEAEGGGWDRLTAAVREYRAAGKSHAQFRTGSLDDAAR